MDERYDLTAAGPRVEVLRSTGGRLSAGGVELFDPIIGSPGQDVIAGGQDLDVVLMIGGLDTFNWAPGDGNDIVEGGAGTDFLHMDGSGADERFDVSAAGGRTRLTRDVGNVNLDFATSSGSTSLRWAAPTPCTWAI